MSKKFNVQPSLVIDTRADLVDFLENHTREQLAYPDCYNIRSNYVVEALHRIALENGGAWKTVYNAQAKKALSLDLLGIELDNEASHREGDVLSLMIYNAQDFRRADMLRDLGFILGTEEMLSQALANKMFIETAGGAIGTPKEIKGSIYAMAPRSRTKHYPVVGQPVRLITKAQATAIETAKRGTLVPDENGIVKIDLFINAPLDLSTLAA